MALALVALSKLSSSRRDSEFIFLQRQVTEQELFSHIRQRETRAERRWLHLVTGVHWCNIDRPHFHSLTVTTISLGSSRALGLYLLEYRAEQPSRD